MRRRRRESKESGGTWICECAQHLTRTVSPTKQPIDGQLLHPAWSEQISRDQCGYEHQRAVGHGERGAVRGGYGDVGAGGGRAGVGTCPPPAGAVVWI